MKKPGKNYINYTMAFLLLYAFIGIAISSFVLWFILPRGRGFHGFEGYCNMDGRGLHGNYWYVFDLPRYMWVEIHSWISVALVILILVHLLLNWRWIVETTKRVKSYIIDRLRTVLERYITSAVLFALFVFQVFSGCVVWLILPRGEVDYYGMLYGSGRTFWGLQRNVWSDLHAWVAVAIVSIILIHIIIHWRWITNMTLGKRTRQDVGLKIDDRISSISPAYEKVTGCKEAIDSEQLVDSISKKEKLIITADSKRPTYIARAGMFFGLFGAISLVVFTANFMLDWVGRYDLILIMVPLPFIILFLAWKKPIIGAVLLIILGVVAVLLNINFTIGVVGYVSGLGLGYTLFFVTFPFLLSGIFFLLSSKKVA